MEKITELCFSFFFKLVVCCLGVAKLDEPLLRLCVGNDAFEIRVVCNVSLPVGVRVAIASPFVPKPIQKRLILGAVDHVCHNVPHVDLDTQRMHKSNDIGIV